MLEAYKEKLRKMGYDGIYIWEDPPETYYDWHTHREDEVRLVLEGSIVIGTEEGVYELGPGDLLEIRAGTKHWARTQMGVKYLCASKRSV